MTSKLNVLSRRKPGYVGCGVCGMANGMWGVWNGVSGVSQGGNAGDGYFPSTEPLTITRSFRQTISQQLQPDILGNALLMLEKPQVCGVGFRCGAVL